MVPHNNIKFYVICNDERILEKIINLYNLNYGTNFIISNWVGGELGFATIESCEGTSFADIFRIGFHFGITEENMRNKGEIDW